MNGEIVVDQQETFRRGAVRGDIGETPQQSRPVDRFDEVVVGAERETELAIVEHRDDDHRNLARLRVTLQLPQHVDAFDTGQHEIERDRHRAHAAREPQRFFAAFRAQAHVAGRLQIGAERVVRDVVIFDDENAIARRDHRPIGIHDRTRNRCAGEFHRQRERERASFVQRAFDFDCSALQLREFLDE